eukprot:8711658-Pyramimonas_sp.AAC.1
MGIFLRWANCDAGERGPGAGDGGAGVQQDGDKCGPEQERAERAAGGGAVGGVPEGQRVGGAEQFRHQPHPLAEQPRGCAFLFKKGRSGAYEGWQWHAASP